jgi:hypothetical protein
MQSGKRLTLKDYFAKHTRTHKNHKNTNVELLLSTVKISYFYSRLNIAPDPQKLQANVLWCFPAVLSLVNNISKV